METQKLLGKKFLVKQNKIPKPKVNKTLSEKELKRAYLADYHATQKYND